MQLSRPISWNTAAVESQIFVYVCIAVIITKFVHNGQFPVFTVMCHISSTNVHATLDMLCPVVSSIKSVIGRNILMSLVAGVT